MARIEYNDTTPSAPSGAKNVKWQSDGNDPHNISAYVEEMTGDSGSGGASGLVPAPAAGDAAANKFFKANGSFEVITSSDVSGLPSQVVYGTIGIVIDGGGTSPSTGSKGTIQIPYSGTITGWTILADQSGSCQITVKKSDYSTFPTTTSIVAAAQPALISAQKNTSTTLTGWTTTFSAGDVFEFNLDSVATCTWITLELKVTKN